MPEPSAPRTPEPRCSLAGAIDRRSHISRPAHTSTSRADLGGAIVKGFPANFSRSASPHQSRSASKGTKAEGRWQPNAPRRKPNAATRSYSYNRSRRASQVAARPGEGPLTEPTPAIRPRPRERVFMPQSRRPTAPRSRLPRIALSSVCHPSSSPLRSSIGTIG
jgi:hypothetical protein